MILGTLASQFIIFEKENHLGKWGQFYFLETKKAHRWTVFV
ncbi:unnamed protein product, partial [marine sediment metagenome]